MSSTTAEPSSRPNADAPAEVARAIFTALAEARWADAAALVHPETLEQFRREDLANAREMADQGAETAEELMGRDPRMAREVAEHLAEQEAELRRKHPPPTLADGFAGVETLAELEALASGETFARFLEAADWRYGLTRQLERAGREVPPGAGAELPRAQHHVLGAVPDGDTLAYVVYRVVHFEDDPDSPSEMQILKMERTPEGWRARNIYFDGHGNVGMQIVEWDGEPPAAETP